jgi:cytochrome c oxidase cbb3-type subunit 3
LSLALAASLLACEQAPSAESLREWTPGDHHSSDDDRVASGAQAAPSAQPERRGNDVAGLVDLTWRQQCTNCHGPVGRGDGQMGPMLHATDLTRKEWQDRVTDAQIATTIKTGKDKMPKFDLPDAVVQGLVARIRQMEAK